MSIKVSHILNLISTDSLLRGRCLDFIGTILEENKNTNEKSLLLYMLINWINRYMNHILNYILLDIYLLIFER